MATVSCYMLIPLSVETLFERIMNYIMMCELCCMSELSELTLCVCFVSQRVNIVSVLYSSKSLLCDCVM